MLKERVKELIDRYESGDENLTEIDVCEELEQIMDEEGDNSDLDVYLMDAIRQYVWARHECARWGGHCSDGSEEFLAEVKRLIGYEN